MPVTREMLTGAMILVATRVAKQYHTLYRWICYSVGVEALAAGCKGLIELNLSGCPQITDTSILAVCKHSTYLRNVNLAYTHITDYGLYRLSRGVCAKKLQVSYKKVVVSKMGNIL